MTDDRNTTTAAGQGDTFMTLAGLLNILWRRRLIVLGLTGLGLLGGVLYGLVTSPLYRASAQVRPGITAYSMNGAPVREWQLKDVTRYFESRIYENRVLEIMGWVDEESGPIIKAEFIARGASNIQGGNVITLSTMAERQDEGERIIESAIEAFIDYAEADSVGNGLHLTRGGLAVRIGEVRNRLATVDVDEQKLRNDIEKARLELSTIDARQQRLDLDMRRLELADAYHAKLADRNAAEAETALTELEDIAHAVEMLRQGEGSAAAAPDVAATNSWLLASLARRDAEAIGTVVQSRLQVREQAFQGYAMADSLRYAIALDGLGAEDLLIKRNIELVNQRLGIEIRINDLEVQIDQGLENRRQSLRNEVGGLQIQLRALTPLERLGEIKVSRKPVRPRKLRAVVILMVLGLLGSVALAFVWEYLEANRAEIFARAPRRD